MSRPVSGEDAHEPKTLVNPCNELSPPGHRGREATRFEATAC